MSDPAVPQNPDPAQTYQDLFDALGRAYWDAPDIYKKDQIQGARDAIYSIITLINQGQLAANTARHQALMGKIKATNDALKVIQDEINQITKNIETVGTVISRISKVLSLFSL